MNRLVSDCQSVCFFNSEVKIYIISFACDIEGDNSLLYVGGAIMVPEEVVEKYDKEMDRRMRQNLERFAEFMARMIEKYGHKVLAEMEREEAEKQQNGQ